MQANRGTEIEMKQDNLYFALLTSIFILHCTRFAVPHKSSFPYMSGLGLCCDTICHTAEPQSRPVIYLSPFDH